MIFAYSETLAQSNADEKNIAAVLVQLPTEHNRIQELKRTNRLKDLALLTREVDSLRQRTVHDFSVHFKACSVYFFNDTDMDLIQQKKFDDILLDSNYKPKPANRIVIDENSNNYLVAYYGYPTFQPKHRGNPNEDADYGPPSGRGLVVLNSNFESKYFFYRLEKVDFMVRQKPNNEFYYKSRKFDIEYYPRAHELENKCK